MLERSFDIARINEVVNHPAVRPFVGPGEDMLDLAPLVARPENWFLMGEHGGFALIWSAPRVHEIHTFILPGGRGVWAKEAAQELIAFAGKNNDIMVWTKVAPGQKNVELFTRSAGLKPTGMDVETFDVPYKTYSLELTSCL